MGREVLGDLRDMSLVALNGLRYNMLMRRARKLDQVSADHSQAADFYEAHADAAQAVIDEGPNLPPPIPARYAGESQADYHRMRYLKQRTGINDVAELRRQGYIPAEAPSPDDTAIATGAEAVPRTRRQHRHVVRLAEQLRKIRGDRVDQKSRRVMLNTASRHRGLATQYQKYQTKQRLKQALRAGTINAHEYNQKIRDLRSEHVTDHVSHSLHKGEVLLERLTRTTFAQQEAARLKHQKARAKAASRAKDKRAKAASKHANDLAARQRLQSRVERRTEARRLKKQAQARKGMPPPQNP